MARALVPRGFLLAAVLVSAWSVGPACGGDDFSAVPGGSGGVAGTGGHAGNGEPDAGAPGEAGAAHDGGAGNGGSGGETGSSSGGEAGSNGGGGAGTGCGNGIIEDGEECDDRNTSPRDGCGRTCLVEAGWSCTDEPSVCATPPSCAGLGPVCQGESCCIDLVVVGGEILPLGDANTGGERDTTVSTFGLDKYEVTVARFRKFVQAYDAWRAAGNPVAGASTHPLIAGSGWQATWNASLPADAAALSSALACNSFATWTNSAAGNEQRPLNCLNWFMAFAFCSWDGARLPTEVEWEYAAAGGSENRTYAWGNTPVPDNADGTYAVYNCLGDGSGAGECAVADLLPVGSKPMGQGRFGHRDIAGSVWEWLIDWHAPSYPETVPANYANVSSGDHRIIRSGTWHYGAQYLPAAYRLAQMPQTPTEDYGVRCARDR